MRGRLNICTDNASPHRRSKHLRTIACSTVLGVFLANSALPGGADIAHEEMHSAGVTLTLENRDILDIDDDGIPDLVVATHPGDQLQKSRYYRGNGDGTFSPGDLLSGGPSSPIAAADINGDAFPDLLQGRLDLSDLLHPGSGAGGFTTPIEFAAETGHALSVASGDLDSDGDSDIVIANGREGGLPDNLPQTNRFFINHEIPLGDFTFTADDISVDADHSRSIALADLDGDGDLDVVVGNDHTTGGSNRVYLNRFMENLSTSVSFDPGIDFGPADDSTFAVLTGDLDADGYPDIVTLNKREPGLSSGVNRFFLNASEPGLFSLGAGKNVSVDTDDTSAGVLADFDSDGDLDLAVANMLPDATGASPRNRLYLNNFIETGTVGFSAGKDISVDEQMSLSLAAADLNNDLLVDIVVGNQNNIAGVSGRDRRYLNNGTSDPFANLAPLIDAQAAALFTDEQTALVIGLDAVTVIDADNVFPNDFRASIVPGENYYIDGNTITPAPGFSGELSVGITVNDGSDDSGVFQLVVTVNDTINTPPSFVTQPIEQASEGITYRYDVKTSDVDVNDIPAIAATTLPAWLAFLDHGDGTATLTGTPAAADIGSHEVALSATDGSATATQTFTITVAATATSNAAPRFTSTPVVDAWANEAYGYSVAAEDDDGDALTITAASALPDWLMLEDHGDGSATLSGTPQTGQEGTHEVELIVSDGNAFATQAFTITVRTAANVTVNSAPYFTSAPVTVATEGLLYSYEVTASEADGHSVTFAAPTLPAWLTLNDHGNGTATLSGAPSAQDAVDHAVSLTVTDGKAASEQNFKISVAKADNSSPPSTAGSNTGDVEENRPPAFTSTAITDGTEGTGYIYELQASDLDTGDILVFSAVTLPAWLTLTDHGDRSGTVEGTPSAADIGHHEVGLQVSDGSAVAQQNFQITVEAETLPVAAETRRPLLNGGVGSLDLLFLFALLAFNHLRDRARQRGGKKTEASFVRRH